MTDRRPRRLAAIMMLDIVGFSRMMSRDDEAATARVVGFHRRIESVVGDFHGRVVDTAGDSVFAVFDSIVEAVEGAASVHRLLAAEAGDDPILVRIGLHFGDVLIEGDNLYGDGVNIAARLEALAPPGGIAVSDVVYQEVRGRLPFTDTGAHTLKNIDRTVRVYVVPPTAFGFPEAVATSGHELALDIDGLDGILAAKDIAAIVREQVASRAAQRSDGDRRPALARHIEVPRAPRTVSWVLSSGGFWVELVGGGALLGSRSAGWTENGLYPLIGCVLVAQAIGRLIAAATRGRAVAGVATRGRAFAALLGAVGLGLGSLFLEGAVSRAIVWVLAAGIGGPALVQAIRGAPRTPDD